MSSAGGGCKVNMRERRTMGRSLPRWGASALGVLFAFGCAAKGSSEHVGSNADEPALTAAPEVQEPKAQIPVRDRLSRSTHDLPRELLPNGMTRIQLEHRFGHVGVARKQADGTLQIECVDRPSALDHALGVAQ